MENQELTQEEIEDMLFNLFENEKEMSMMDEQEEDILNEEYFKNWR